MLTAGIDLSAQPKKTAACVLRWSSTSIEIETLDAGLHDPDLVELCCRDDIRKIGIDCPFGWPAAFSSLVAGHLKGQWPDHTDESFRRSVLYRVTDARLREQGFNPMSVAAEKIAVPALRCASVLAQVGTAKGQVSRDGSGQIAEVYPGAALKIWGLTHRGYKHSKGKTVRSRLVSDLASELPTLDLADHTSDLEQSDDIFDALVAALVARACALGRTSLPDENEAAAASVEGWIHLPLAGSVSDSCLAADDDAR